MDPPRKPAPYQTQHRKIALYGILGMAFVLFFILFVIVNQSEADKRLSRLEIARSFANETSIESSLGRGTLLTTPFSAPETIEEASAEARKQRRSRRLGNIGNVPDPLELNDNLVLFPSSYLKPPRPGSMQQFAEDRSLKETVRDKPRPFGYVAGGENPIGFRKPNRTLEDSELGQSLKHYGLTNNIQDVLKQLSSSREQRYKLFPQQQQQPSEFSNPAYRNHRVKFTGIYRHPRKNGDITTLFGAASRQHELQLTKPQVINSQLAVPNNLMPDSLYNFRPSHPSDVNLLASEQFRFAPENDPNQVDNLPKGMPFSIMLDILPMASGGSNNRFKRPTKRKPSGHNYSNVNFPSYFNNRNFAQVKHALYNNHQHSEPNTYYRSSTTNNYQRQLQNFFPTMKPGKLMVHLNLYPKQPEADRKFELEKSSLNINHLQLNFGEHLPDPERHKAVEPTQSSVRNYLDMISRSAEEYITSTTTTTELPLFVSSFQSPTASSFADHPKNITFPNEHVAMGRYPPYGRQVKRRLQYPHHLHHLQEINWELEPRGAAAEELSPVDEDAGPERLDVVRFDEGDAI